MCKIIDAIRLNYENGGKKILHEYRVVCFHMSENWSRYLTRSSKLLWFGIKLQVLNYSYVRKHSAKTASYS